MKLPFQKKQSAPSPQVPPMPPEIQQYYKAERRERTGVAWLLAIGTLLITIAIIVGLFLGGRWLYRKATHKSTSSTTSQTNSGNSQQKNTNKPAQGSGSGSSSGGTLSSGTSNGSGTSSGNKTAPSTPVPTPGAAGSVTTGGVVPPTAARTSIPNTGPGDTIAIFFAVSATGYAVHRLVLSKKR